MKKRPTKKAGQSRASRQPRKTDRTAFAERLEKDPMESPRDLRQKEDLIHLQEQIAQDLSRAAKKNPEVVSRLIDGFLEIADFMFKNTCGVGSSYRLAECEVGKISAQDIQQYYKLLLVVLAYHFSRLNTSHRETVWDAVVELTGDRGFCESFSEKLESCLDHENGDFSPVKAGHHLWQQVRESMHVLNSDVNTAARIYYQTAPGQNLLFIVEQATEEGWLEAK